MKRDLTSLKDLTGEEIHKILGMTQQLKADKNKSQNQLAGKSVGLLFQKPSNRTRVSFEVGIYQLGGNCVYLGPQEINLGVRETPEDVSRTLSRYLDAIVARTHRHEDILNLAKSSTIPIINGLSDLSHPCQALTDIFSVKEKFGKIEGITLAYVGDGNNVCHSLLLGCSKLGMHLKIACPKGYEPLEDIVKLSLAAAKISGSQILITRNPKEAVKDAEVIYADTWVSMGQEKETKKRLKDLKNFQVNSDLVKLAKKNYIFMHCLPAHRGQEVTAEIIDGPHSIIFDQAENRLHTQKAILIFLLG
jgi:ornithine carbamoyltransferase